MGVLLGDYPTAYQVGVVAEAALPKALRLASTTATAFTLPANDGGYLLTMNNGSAQTLTFPTNASAAIPIGAVGEVISLGVGTVTFAAASGATINSRGGLVKTNGQYSTVRWRKISTNGFIISGDLAA